MGLKNRLYKLGATLDAIPTYLLYCLGNTSGGALFEILAEESKRLGV